MSTEVVREYRAGNSKTRHGLYVGGTLVAIGLWVTFLAGDSVPDRTLTGLGLCALGAALGGYGLWTGQKVEILLRLDRTGVWYKDWGVTVPWPSVGDILHTGNKLDEPFRLGALAKDTVRSLKAELGRLGLFLAGFALLLPLNLFPPIGTAIYGGAFTVLTLFFLGWEYLDFSMERWHLGFGAKRKLAFGNLGALLSFGAGAILLLVIPLVNLLAIPVCVIGGTLLICDLRESGRTPAAPPTNHGQN